MPGRPRKRIAVMQPYFFPYAGYFRLFSAVDEFVLFDCVQFPRRGRVHRTQVADATHATSWLTLPLAGKHRDVLIRDLEFSRDARQEFDARLARLPWIEAAQGAHADAFRTFLRQPLEDVVGFLENGLGMVASALGVERPVLRSSRLDIDPALRGQARVVAIANAVGATHYLNAPGGRLLYEPDAFAGAGIELEFLPPYQGSYFRLLPALLAGEAASIRIDILARAAPANSGGSP